MKQLTGTACLQMERVSQGQSDWVLQRLFLEERWREAPTQVVRFYRTVEAETDFHPHHKKSFYLLERFRKTHATKKAPWRLWSGQQHHPVYFQGQHYTRAHWKKNRNHTGVSNPNPYNDTPRTRASPHSRTPQASSMNGKKKYLLPLGIGC